MAKKKRVKLIDLTKAIDAIIAEYGEAVYDVMQDSVKQVTDEATEKLRAVNHWRNDGSGAYAGGWGNEAVLTSRINQKMVVYNGPHYRLTHLLENGHVIRNGTQRSYGKTDAFPHIAPVNDWASNELPQLVKRKVGNL